MDKETPLLTLGGNIVKGIDPNLSPEAVKYWNGHCDELHRGMNKFLGQIPISPSIFGPAKQIVLPERKEPFIPNKVIVVGNTAANISYVDPEILAIGTAIPPRGPVTIDYRPLVFGASFKEINRALPSTPVTLDMIYGLCLLQPKGPKSKKWVLRTDGWANLFPNTLIGEEPRAVFVCWSHGGWYFFALSVDFTNQWHEGSLVFSLTIPES